MPGTEHGTWGTGERIVLVHGSFATGPTGWEGQRAPAEPAVFGAAREHPGVVLLRERMTTVLARPGTDQEFVDAFLAAVGTSVEDLAQELVADMVAMAPAVRYGRPAWESQVPVESLSEARFPVLAVSGNHHPPFTAMCESLARDLGAEHRTVEGAGHEMQLAVGEFNSALLALWGRTG